MRIHLKVKAENIIIPFNHQPLLVGTIHKWLGWNELHGNIALFSFSRLNGAQKDTKGLKFNNGTSFFISAYDVTVIKSLIKGIQKDSTMFYGLEVDEIIIEQNPDLSSRDYFQVGSPIFIKRKVENSTIHYLYNDTKVNELMKETLLSKMKQIGLEDDSLEIQFDMKFSKASIMLIDYSGIKNRVNWCPIIIKGKHETKLFAWNVGIGNSTGIGFGAIK